MDERARWSGERPPLQSLRATTEYLSDEHFAELVEGSGVDPVLLEGCYRTVTTEEAQAVGFSERQARDGLLTTLYSPTGEVYYALKPDKPRIEVTNNGKRKIHKYEIQRTRAPVIVDVHPSLRRRLLVSEEPLYVTEGAKKADCLASRNRLAVEIFGVESRRVGGDVSGRRAFPTGMPCRSRVAGSTSPLTPTF